MCERWVLGTGRRAPARHRAVEGDVVLGDVPGSRPSTITSAIVMAADRECARVEPSTETSHGVAVSTQIVAVVVVT